MDHGDLKDSAWGTGKRDGELSDEIIRLAEAAGEKARSPDQHRPLRFSNSLLERAYLRAEHRLNRTYYVASMCMVTLVVASFFWTDPWLLAPEMLHPFRVARVFLSLPLCVMMLVVSLRIVEPMVWIRAAAVCLVLFGLVYSGLLLFAGPTVFLYLEAVILQVILASFLLFGLPFRWSMPIAGVFGVTFGAATYRVSPNWGPIFNFGVDFMVCTFLGGAAAFRYESTSRREFIAHLLSRKDYAERLAADGDRRRWLEVIAAFLRHELKNTMTAISSSIELADRAAPHADAHKYLDRGRRSVQYMQQLLTKAADATNLDAALAQQEFEAVDFSNLIVDRVEDFKTDMQDRAFEVDIEPGIYVLGHADSLVQMFDKLMDNALEHGDRAFPVRIELRKGVEGYALTVSDVGDPLPVETEQLFEPFFTKKLSRSGEANLGLGLFVARTIASRHDGNISAVPLDDAVGARFVVRFSPMAHTASPGEPTIATPSFGANSVEARVDL
jgi:signal transduction histidine kinase